MTEGKRLAIERFESIPFQHSLGLKIESLDDSQVVCRFENRADLLGHEARRFLHGGVIAAAIDSVGGFVAGTAAGIWLNVSDTAENPVTRLATIDMRVDYLSPGQGDWFRITGWAQKVGRRFVSTRMELHNDAGELLATGTANFMY